MTKCPRTYKNCRYYNPKLDSEYHCDKDSNKGICIREIKDKQFKNSLEPKKSVPKKLEDFSLKIYTLKKSVSGFYYYCSFFILVHFYLPL